MKKIVSILIGVIFLISGCSYLGSSPSYQKTIIDALGREVELSSEPSRIIIIGKQAPMLTNFMYLFNTTDKKLLALEKRSQSADEFLKLIDKNIDKKFKLERGAGAEQVVPLNPDMVILKTSMRDTIGKPLEDLSIPVVYVEFENADQIYRDLRIFASVLNEEERGEDLISSYQMYYQKIQDLLKVSNSSEKPSVLLLQAESEDQKYIFKVPPANWLQTDMVEKAGGIAVWKEANLAGGWTEVNMEQISNWNADMVYIVNYQGQSPEIVKNLKNDEIWKNLNAAKDERIYAFAYDFLSWDQPDPRWILGYGWMAFRQNPQSISSTDIQNLIKDYYQKFFTLDESAIEEKIDPMVADYFK